jgi:uncharacterized protein YhfF
MNREQILSIAKPILFNTEMVRAILDGRKTVTRRIAKGNILNQYIDADFLDTVIKDPYNRITDECKYKIGDYLYVRETFKVYEKAVGRGETFGIKKFLAYKADENDNTIQKPCEFYDVTWTPSIHMPKEAARIFLKVTDVRVERLQDMDAEDALKEGCGECSEEEFAQLWNSTIKKTNVDDFGWGANPWVWVIEFEKVEVE